MTVVEKLDRRIKTLTNFYGRPVAWDWGDQDDIELLEAALKHIRQQDVHIALLSTREPEWPKSRLCRP